MKQYVIQYNSNPKKYLYIENPEETFYLKMKCFAVDEIAKATRFESIQKASYICESNTYEKVKGSVIKL